MSVLEDLAEGRVSKRPIKPGQRYRTSLSAANAEALVREMAELGVHFGVPMDGVAPLPREPEERWRYLGIVLGDLHVYAPVDAGEEPPP